MKKYLFLLPFLLFPVTARAQPVDWGGMGYFSTGPILSPFGELSADLELDSSAGPGSAPRNTPMLIGGGALTVLAAQLVLGGHGFGMISPGRQGDNGFVHATGGGGGFIIGWLVRNDYRVFAYPFAGFGGWGFAMEIENTSSSDISFGGDTIAPGASHQYSAGFPVVELGIGVQQRFFDFGGFMVGAELGFLASLSSSGLKTRFNDTVPGVSETRLTGGYVRITIGSGGFAVIPPPPPGLEPY